MDKLYPLKWTNWLYIPKSTPMKSMTCERAMDKNCLYAHLPSMANSMSYAARNSGGGVVGACEDCGAAPKIVPAGRAIAG